MRPARALAFLLLAAAAPATPATLPAELEPAHFELENGMTFLVVERPGRPLVSALWAVRGGSAGDPPGQRGLAHVVEHLLFAGSRTLGTADWEAEAGLLRQWERLYEDSVRRRRAAPGLARLEGRLATLQRPGEYSAVYTRAGAFGLDAETRHDSTVFQVLAPAEKIELWFWMESDRLLEPVFRGFERELRVVEQERRQRIDSSPAGSWFELFDAAFWGAGHPYAHTPGGDRLEIAGLLPSDARAHFEAAYRPERLVAVLVGDLAPERARELAERYFGRLEPGSRSGRGGAVQGRRPVRPACRSGSRISGRTLRLPQPDRDPLSDGGFRRRRRRGRARRAGGRAERPLGPAPSPARARRRRGGNLGVGAARVADAGGLLRGAPRSCRRYGVGATAPGLGPPAGAGSGGRR